MDQELGQKKFFIPSKKWWFILQCGMILVLFIVGLIRGGDIIILSHRIAEALLGLAVLIIGYPWGVYFLFFPDRHNIGSVGSRFYILIALSIVYYISFFVIINYVYKYKKFARLLALALLLAMLLNFAGCVRVVDIPLIIT
ncbi:MAG: hypothetical protein A2534_03490 [Candidatus Magasanikbacteria bacterium RIFOXYD2_FULL_39_9]|uniref:Uncharacterized protein n=1 Tax=Candidatus Magasanikbacteria bacterium RIFOXYD1_FULL_40_23 TaxID=1798705 RepID=A0A1F6P876_9BACT|nr:MAG: hypothetical protein A2563_05030 [Candidatus Magasanikbacteria bacterium RIFOXYD1_FULL_40_23]OGH92988.1 MAG: hypothetical protein A2534_03490 [Candidatus Magasanikbacteria bacterium RIFOXYD2_FULL_39_9]